MTSGDGNPRGASQEQSGVFFDKPIILAIRSLATAISLIRGEFMDSRMNCWIRLTTVFFVFFLFCTPSFAQGASAIDLDTENKLEKLDPADIDALDAKLAAAIELYYDKAYAQALPIFQEISETVETADLMFWIGDCALETRDYQLASEKFRKILLIDPSLHRERIKLGETYLRMGKIPAARNELETVSNDSPTPAEKQEIDTLLAEMGGPRQKLSWNIRFSTGLMYDSNVGVAPEEGGYQTARGTIQRNKDPREDGASVSRLTTSMLYDMGAANGWMWNTGLYLYNKSYFDYSSYNYFSADLYTGPWWISGRHLLRIPFGYRDTWYGGNHNSATFHIDPSYRYFFNQNFSLTSLFTYGYTDYHKSGLSDLDYNQYRFQVTPTLSTDDKINNFSATLGYDIKDAGEDTVSYDGLYFSVAYLGHIFPHTDLVLRYSQNNQDYDGTDRNYLKGRDDRRHTMYLGATYSFLENYFASVELTHTMNTSNMEIYEYDRTTVTTSIGCNF